MHICIHICAAGVLFNSPWVSSRHLMRVSIEPLTTDRALLVVFIYVRNALRHVFIFIYCLSYMQLIAAVTGPSTDINFAIAFSSIQTGKSMHWQKALERAHPWSLNLHLEFGPMPSELLIVPFDHHNSLLLLWSEDSCHYRIRELGFWEVSSRRVACRQNRMLQTWLLGILINTWDVVLSLPETCYYSIFKETLRICATQSFHNICGVVICSIMVWENPQGK